MAPGRLTYGRQDIDEDDLREVVACLKSDFLTQGPRIDAFEEALCVATGARYAVATCNGSAALELAAVALGLGDGDVALVPAVTFLASAHCVRHAGGVVEFTDVEADTGLVSIASLETKIKDVTATGRAPRLIVPVDLTGQPSDWSAVRRVARKAGARVLLDAAHSLGATSSWDGRARRVGESGADAAILSFHPVKHVTTAEGGAVLTDDESLYRAVRELRSFGVHKDARRFIRDAADPFVGPWYYEANVIGHNYRLSDVHAALGLSQLGKLDRFVARRREIARKYDAALADATFRDRLLPIAQRLHRNSAYHLYVVRVLGGDAAEAARARHELYSFLRAREIHCQVHYVPLPWQPCYRKEGERDDAYPGARDYYASCLSLPMYPALTDGDVARVVDALQVWAGSSGGS